MRMTDVNAVESPWKVLKCLKLHRDHDCTDCDWTKYHPVMHLEVVCFVVYELCISPPLKK